MEPNITKNNQNHLKRCDWSTKDPLYIAYHDLEWGKPQYDGQKLFEMLCLGGQQAGLSWITILRKREYYRQLFYCFDPYKISQLTAEDVQKLLSDARILRNKCKIESIIHNARCYIEMKENEEDFSEFIWTVVDRKPIINSWDNNKQIPTETLESIKLSKELKKRGFTFVGPIICYAFMQSCGLVNDHIVSCHCRNK